jgi:hypothetical protein
MAHDEDITPQRNGAALPIITNSILLLCTAGVLWWAITTYQEQVRTATLEESRFVTMEWNLLQQLKAQTDRQLSEKDQEIADLRRRYQEALRTDSDTEERNALQAQLAQAEEERRSIVSQRLETTDARTEADEADASDAPDRSDALPNLDALVSNNATPLVEALRTQMTALRAQLAERDVRIDNLQDEIEQLQSVLSTPPNTSSVRPTVIATVQGDRHPPPPLDTVELLNTRALIKAILSTPEVRSEYPDLTQRMDRYTESVETRARQDSREQTLESAATAIEAAAGEMGISLPDMAPAHTPEGYADRLLGLIRGVTELLSNRF